MSTNRWDTLYKYICFQKNITSLTRFLHNKYPTYTQIQANYIFKKLPPWTSIQAYIYILASKVHFDSVIVGVKRIQLFP